MPPLPPHFVSFAWRYRTCARRSLPGIASAPPWAWACSAGRPPRSTGSETTRPLRFLGDPHAYMPRSPTPARSPRQAYLGVSMLPSVYLTTSALAAIVLRGSITRPAHSLSSRFAGRITPPPRNTRFRLVASLCRAGLTARWVPAKGFRACQSHLIPLPQALPDALAGTNSRSSHGYVHRRWPSPRRDSFACGPTVYVEASSYKGANWRIVIIRPSRTRSNPA